MGEVDSKTTMDGVFVSICTTIYISLLKLDRMTSQHVAMGYLHSLLVSAECNALLPACAQFAVDIAQALMVGESGDFHFLFIRRLANRSPRSIKR